MRIAVTGASGFVGRHVTQELQRRGATVRALGRVATAPSPEVEFRQFDPNGAPDPWPFENIDAVIHLAGETVAGRWTPSKKRRIAESRIAGTRTLVESLKRLSRRPAVLVTSSAVGYYGDRGDEVLTESSDRGRGFLADVCVAWEAAARECEAVGVRCVQMRTGIVLGDGGALAQMRLPFQFFAGGPIGRGRQFVPWIHVRDLAALYCFAIDRLALHGPLNAVTPDYMSNARLADAIGAALQRPSLLPAPAPALRLLLGEFATTLLSSQLIVPAVAEDTGFNWSYPQLESAVASILGKTPKGARVRTFNARQFIPRPLEEVFAFFSTAKNLESITPPSLSFSIRNMPESIERGSILEYDLKLRGFPTRWTTLIAQYRPLKRFVDVQLRGPYRLWRHIHDFTAVTGGTEIADTIEYALPYPPLGELFAAAVSREVEHIFQYRREAIARRFPDAARRRNHSASDIARAFTR